MKLAIMQPYFFPYLGYWQLIHAVDRFVIYDDVNFIKKGWVNRNRILVNGLPTMITVAIEAPSQHRLISDLDLHPTTFQREKMLKTLMFAYRKSRHFEQVYPVVKRIVSNPDSNLARFLEFGIRTICELLGIGTEIVSTSRVYGNAQLRGQARILDICRMERASKYVNAKGGAQIYSPAAFAEAGIEVRFLVMRQFPYAQRRAGEFVPSLSIIDALMEVGTAGVRSQLDQFDLVTAGELNET